MKFEKTCMSGSQVFPCCRRELGRLGSGTEVQEGDELTCPRCETQFKLMKHSEETGLYVWRTIAFKEIDYNAKRRSGVHPR